MEMFVHWLKFVAEGLIFDKSALVQVMPWHQILSVPHNANQGQSSHKLETLSLLFFSVHMKRYNSMGKQWLKENNNYMYKKHTCISSLLAMQ